MLKPFYQGKLDTFCAIYAVLNALRLTHGIRTLKAREILVRHFSDPQLDDYVRITIGTQEQMQTVVEAITAIVKGR